MKSKAPSGSEKKEEPQEPALKIIFLEDEDFAKLAEQYLGDAGMATLQNELSANPDAGDVVSGAGGARKIRVALQGRGKRGGARVIYYYRDSRNAIFFLALYPKNKKSDLTPKEKEAIKEQIRTIKEDSYP
jgi:mRNA-degrading endonuclease RelE of RelBE toxin-antitoxin system